jgi:hypothetical protein
MLKNLFYSALIMMCYPIISCKKAVGKLTTYTVTEYKSNKPIPGASVSFYTIGSLDLNCGCWTDQLQGTKLTDQNGNCTLGDEEYTLSTTKVFVSKDNYFPDGSSSTPLQTNFALETMGQIQLDLVRTNAYTGRIFIDLNVGGELHSYNPVGEFPAPVDSLIILSGYGGETNNISYRIYDSTGSTVIFTSTPVPLQVSQSGTTNLKINY